METQYVIEILRLIITLLLGGLMLYFQANSKLKSKIAGLIAEAEALYRDTVKAGGQKHQYVTDKLHSMVPVYLKPVLTKELLSILVDNTFQSMERYAKQQLDKLMNRS